MLINIPHLTKMKRCCCFITKRVHIYLDNGKSDISALTTKLIECHIIKEIVNLVALNTFLIGLIKIMKRTKEIWPIRMYT